MTPEAQLAIRAIRECACSIKPGVSRVLFLPDNGRLPRKGDTAICGESLPGGGCSNNCSVVTIIFAPWNQSGQLDHQLTGGEAGPGGRPSPALQNIKAGLSRLPGKELRLLIDKS